MKSISSGVASNSKAEPIKSSSSLFARGNVRSVLNDGAIGTILIENGRLSVENAERILTLQKDQNRKFGDIAIELGFLTEDDIHFALSRQFDDLYLASDDNSLDQQLVAAYQPFSLIAEQLRALRTQLILRRHAKEGRQDAIAIVSANGKEGRSFMSANLAIVFSQLGERTLLIDADLRTPTQHIFFKLGNVEGLSGILAGRTGMDAIGRIPSLPGLCVLPAGAVPPNPQELFGRAGFIELLGSLAQEFDTIILDTPAAGKYAEAQMIAVSAGAALLIARKDRSSMSDVIRLTRNLQQTQTDMIGSVFNQF